jgi:hypothetical protein
MQRLRLFAVLRREILDSKREKERWREKEEMERQGERDAHTEREREWERELAVERQKGRERERDIERDREREKDRAKARYAHWYKSTCFSSTTVQILTQKGCQRSREGENQGRRPKDEEGPGRHSQFCTQFTCFTGTKVQILTQKALQRRPRRGRKSGRRKLRSCAKRRGRGGERETARARYSVYLLYWYKSTNADAEGAEGAGGERRENASARWINISR